MRVEQFDGSTERKALIAMVTNSTVLGRVAAKWNGDLFANPWANLIGKWCVDYHRRYGMAPRAAIEPIYSAWVEKHGREDVTSEMVGKFLSTLSSESEQNGKINPDYAIDLIGNHLHQVQLDKLKNGIQTDLDKGELEKAENRINKHAKIELGIGEGIDWFLDKDAIFRAFDKNQQGLVIYPGALGRFFGQSLKRNGFISFMAPEKGLKSFWLMDIAFRAMLQRLRVAYFVTGDMEEEEVGQRLASRVASWPTESSDGKWPYIVDVPTAIHPPSREREESELPIAKVDFEKRKFDNSLPPGKVWQVCQRVMRSEVKSDKSYLKLSVRPSGTVSVGTIRSVLDGWARAGFVADVCVIDYADVLEPMDKRQDRRDQYNEIWMGLRGLSLSHHVLLVTATQADAGSYEKFTLDRRNFSEDKRKLAHVTGMVGICMVSEERKRGLCRLNWIVRRKGKGDSRRTVHVAGCLDFANPAILSTF